MTSLLAAIAVLFFASMLQSITGSGFGLVAAPLLLMVDPDLVPGPLLVLTVVAMASVLWRDGRYCDLRTTVRLGIALLPGVLVGVWLISAVDPVVLTAVTAAMSIAAAVAAFAGARLPQRKSILTGAGALGGLMGVIAALPGPPLALAYAPDDRRTLRATLSVYFLAVSVVSLIMLHVAGGAEVFDWRSMAVLAPAVALGGATGGRIANRISVSGARRVTSLVILIAGSVLLVRTVA
ncbi:TSUP family transporter [Gordonia sp. HNM0687]|uniref:Probable membrane transporter protein n=1 Tax=Gordonia mangrovi TaxID=2665643 RepID=A0A6L7GU61_9ACTN|nr:sulfite exporter TauE/SafE family protein [Gordonia mangrovi]MXP23539.1 TSUP family transporter [Gordonia mangrovi]UVF76566.1 sulfite exporter TauE/SafE family protein [Gordonia mangrovi]